MTDLVGEIPAQDEANFNSKIRRIVGMLLVALITVVSQYVFIQKTIKSNLEKVQHQK